MPGKVREKFGVFPGQIRGDFGGRFDTDLHCKRPFSGPGFTHVNLSLINYRERFGGDSGAICRGKFGVFPGQIPVILVVDFGGDLQCKWPVSGPGFTHVNLSLINYRERFGGDLAAIWQSISCQYHHQFCTSESLFTLPFTGTFTSYMVCMCT